MKKGLLLIGVLVIFSSCDVTIFDEPFDPRNNFVGRFEAEEYSETYDLTSFYDVRIVKDGNINSNVIYLRNFYAVDIEVYAEIIGDRINIPRQVVGGYLVQGTGRNEYGEIHLSYTVEDTFSRSGAVDFCRAVLY